MLEALSNPLWGFLGVIVGLIGVVFSLECRRFRRLSYAVRRFTILGERVGDVDGLEVSYAGTRVPKLFEYRVLIWNSGSEVVHPADFATCDPPRLVIPEWEGKVIGVSVLGTSTQGNQALVGTNQPGTVAVGFEYLAPRDGIVLSVLCQEELAKAPQLAGLLKGGELLGGGIISRPPRLVTGWVVPSLVAVSVSVGLSYYFCLYPETRKQFGQISGLYTMGFGMLAGLVARVVCRTLGGKPGCEERVRELFERGFHDEDE